MPMCNLIEYIDSYSKTLGSLWQCRNEPAFTGACAVDNSLVTVLCLNFNKKITCKTADDNTKEVEIIVLLKYLSSFWRTLGMSLINCGINLILTWSDKYMLLSDTKQATSTITDTKVYVGVVTLSTKDNAKLLQPLKSGLNKQVIRTNINQK